MREDGGDPFLARWERLEEEYMRHLCAAYGRPGPWADRLRAAATETFDLVEEHPRAAHFMVVDTLAVGEVGQLRQQALLTRIATMIDDVRAQLDNPELVPASASAWVVRIFFDRIFRSLSAGQEAGLSDHLPQLMFLAVSSYLGPELGRAELRAALP